MEMELHFPKELAEDYAELNPSYSIFDAPFTEGIDRRFSFHTTPGFRIVFRRFRKYFRRKTVGKDLKVYHYDDCDNRVYYDVTCTLRKYYQIERLVFTHAVLTYRHPIAKFLAEYNIPDNLSLSLYDKIAFSVKEAEVTFPFSGGPTDPVINVCIPENLLPISMSDKDLAPISVSSQLMYSISKFMIESGLLSEVQADELEFECEWYEKKVEHALREVKKELEQIINEDKLALLIKTLWDRKYIAADNGNGVNFIAKLDLGVYKAINDFNVEHGTEFTSDDVLQALNRFVRMKRIVYEDDEWRLRV
jgi:hypothetical protein